MRTCRICLLNKNFLHSLSDLYRDITYLSMLKYVADIKVAEGNNNTICSGCCQKLRESYFFKTLIIRSDQELNVKSKVFKFDLITDVEGIIFKNISRKQSNCSPISYSHIFNENSESTLYNDTVIKRFKGDMEQTRIKGEYGADKQNECNGNCKDDLHNIHEESYTIKRMKSKISDDNNKICIKPKLLDDYRIMPYRKFKDHKMGNVKKKQVKREDICPYCGKKTTTMKTHILVHTGKKQYKCSQCEKEFYTKYTLKEHTKLHINRHSIKCEKCIATFSARGALKRHMLMHSDVKKYKCNLCEKFFKRKVDLQRHALIHYTGAKSFVCDICNMSFFTNYALKTHSRVHTGERPFKCELCSQPYSYKRDFNKHCLKKHGVILHRKPIYTMNEEVLKQEKNVVKDLVLHVNGLPTEREPLEVFHGPQAALAFDKAVKVIKQNEIPFEISVEIKECDDNE